MDKQKRVIKRLINEARRIVEKKETDLSLMNALLSRQSLIHFGQWNENKSYTRVCLHEELEFELILLCWQPKAKTAVHNHNEQNCSVFFFDSDFQETVYCDQGKEVLEVKKIEKGGTSSMIQQSACHSLQSLSDSKVMSLHLYNKPIKTCEVIQGSENETCLDWKVLEYDTKISY